MTETAVCKRLSVAGRVYVFIAYKEGRIGAFFLLLHTLFRMNFRKFINKNQAKVSLIFFLSVKFPIRKKDIIK